MSNNNLNQAIREYNNAAKVARRAIIEVQTYPRNNTLPNRPPGHRHYSKVRGVPNNVLNRHNIAIQRYRQAYIQLARTAGIPQNNFGFFEDMPIYGAARASSDWSSAAIHPRLRTRASEIRRKAAVNIQKHWRGRQTRMNLRFPKPPQPTWPRLHRLAVAIGLRKPTTISLNQLKKMNYIMRKHYNK